MMLIKLFRLRVWASERHFKLKQGCKGFKISLTAECKDGCFLVVYGVGRVRKFRG